ncbi:glucanotransferase domain of glycogen debranching enzyme-domain-containing protein [Dipodascopsis tothii]|uniref:glucanotransferase domain of glycogen debranching enzyme-domain-containing protein n=1 Tax=Dipodascopsis tothii TaxID=44089 RepID=UPI0034CFCCF4
MAHNCQRSPLAWPPVYQLPRAGRRRIFLAPLKMTTDYSCAVAADDFDGPAPAGPAVYVLELDGAGAPALAPGGVLALPPPHEPYTLRFRLGGGAAVAREATLWCTAPPPGAAYAPDKFHGRPLAAGFARAAEADVLVDRPGVYAFYVTYVPLRDFLAALATEPARTPTHHFTVAPRLACAGAPLPSAALAIQSVVSKWMGPPAAWDAKLAAVRAKGYNMVHFTPLQARGESNSPYSIYDQLAYDPAAFPAGEADVAALVARMRDTHGLLAMTDVVWNHTASNSAWLRDHPEAGYSVATAPHLRPAYELDSALLAFGRSLRTLGLPTTLESEADLTRVMDGIKVHVLGALRLWEFYVVDVDAAVDAAVAALPAAEPAPLAAGAGLEEVCEYVRSTGGAGLAAFGARHERTLDAAVLAAAARATVPDGDVAAVRAELVRVVDEINLAFYRDYDADSREILSQTTSRIRYTRLDAHGPRLGAVSAAAPLTDAYFTRVELADGAVVGLANNGWIWNGDPLVDFASPASRAYLRREVIAWGDCVKLRYGAGPADSPWLWAHMRAYTEACATLFDAVRIDNCHSTPLHVGEHLLACARRVRPDLYVVAELFTGSEATDGVFVRQLGINALIREAMQAWSPGELSRLVFRHGGRPIGSLAPPPGETRLVASAPDALFMDCTHDNETPAQKRTVEDTLPTAGLVAMCACAAGSVLGFDECFPQLLDIVAETREYDVGGGIGPVKAVLNRMHEDLGRAGADELYVDHADTFVTVHRFNARLGRGWLLVARTSFGGPAGAALPPVVLDGTRARPVLAASLKRTGEFESSPDRLRAIPTALADLDAPAVDYDAATDRTTVRLPAHFPPGSIALLRTSVPAVDACTAAVAVAGAADAVAGLDLADLNLALYRCDAEERDLSAGRDGVYDVPGHGALVYAGLAGFATVLADVVGRNDLGHALCAHLRAGQWALDFVAGRLERHAALRPALEPLAVWLRERFAAVRGVPSFLLPKYFGLIVLAAHDACAARALAQMPAAVGEAEPLVRGLGLVSVQMAGLMASASLRPATATPCLAAGLPHFSSGFMRCWGRDVFISLRGLLIATGRHAEAREHILAFAATLKHGLIPNLLDSGRNPRYNARDAVWLFLQSVQDYVATVPGGAAILDEPVARRFPLDDRFVEWDSAEAFSYSTSLREIVFEVLQRHAAGIHYREHNAGPALDSQMSDAGFNVDVVVDWATGFVHGGSQWNCGTWMDKMGESTTAGNRGWPGTPRDGAAVEIIGLLKSALRWTSAMAARGEFPPAVTTDGGRTVTLAEWDGLVQAAFERRFYVPADAADDADYDVNPACVNRRGIYKDLYRSGKEYEDYQLRPNFAIAMVVAPELFDVDRALGALAQADAHLRGPVGMATLDPSDLNYRPYYLNSVDSDDFRTAKGRNYHQGPEWVWCTGYFLRAMLAFDLRRKTTPSEKHESLQQVYRRLDGHRAWLAASPWAGLAELTQKNGELCGDSSPTQAWSAATLLDLVHDASLVL